MRDRCLQIGAWLGVLLAVQCRRDAASRALETPPGAAATGTAQVSAGNTRPLAPGSGVPTVTAAPSAPAPVVSASAAAAAPAAPSASSAAAADDPPLLAADGTPLPQTEERPSVSSERFQRRMQALAHAILLGDSEPARATFFPLVAYAQVKDVQKPERDYRYRLLAHFERDIREYHQKLGPDAARAEFLGVTVPEARAEWMKPGREGNRLGYFRVLRSSLRFRLGSGREQSFELTSMISWRGEWYVVHLHGFE